ncbi:unnamed protein product, partial [Sphacelaria rigidula]
GLNCGFRHSEAASNTERICNRWAAGYVCDGRCNLRHPSAAELAVPPPTPIHHRRPRPVFTPPQQPPHQSLNLTTTPKAPAAEAGVGAPPCRFYAQGRCVKGSTCPFLHTPQAVPQSLKAAAVAARTAGGGGSAGPGVSAGDGRRV